MDVADRIRSERKRKGLTQEELARRAGLTLNGFAEIERGHILDPRLSTLRKIALALGIPVESLLRSHEKTALPKGEAPQEGAEAQPFPDVLEMGPDELKKLRARAREDKSVFDALVAEHTAVLENVMRMREQRIPDVEMDELYKRHVILRKLWKVALFERLHSVPAAEWPGRKPEAPTYPDTTGFDLDKAYDVWSNARVPVGAG